LKNKNKLEEFLANPKKAIWKLSIPMMFGMSIHALYMLADIFFITNLIDSGQEMTSGLADIFPIIFIIMGVTMGLGSGSTTVIAQNIGSGNDSDANSAAEHILLFGILLASFFIISCYLFGENILVFQGGTNPQYVQDYYYTYLLGIPFMVLNWFFRAILAGEGDTLFPVKLLGIGTIINIILDPIFIIYYGIIGAASATVISHSIVFLLFVYSMLYKKTSYISLNFKIFKYNKSILYKVLYIGIPAASSMLIMAVGTMFINKILMTAPDGMGTFAKGANVVTRTIEHFVFIPFISISTSLVTIIGMFYGAKKKNHIQVVVKYSIKAVMIISVFFSTIYYLFSDQIMSIFFNKEPITKNIGIDYLCVFSLAIPFIALTMISTKTIQGLGNSIPTFIISLLRVIIINCTLSYYFITIQGYDVIFAWYSIVISCVISALISIYWLRLELKKIKIF